MTKNISALSAQEALFLSRLAAEGKEIFTVAKARAAWPGATDATQALSRLVRKGWLQRLQRGSYLLIPLAAGPERNWSESAMVIASHLIRPAAVAYWSALHYWDMTEQVPQVILVQSTRRKRPIEIAGMRFRFITVKEDRFFGVVRRTLDDKPVHVTDREKTLLDAAARPDLCGGVPQLAQALRAAHRDVDWPRLDGYLARWGGGTVVKRLGYLVESLALPIPETEARLGRWQAMLTEGISPLEPGAGRAGRTVTRWRVDVNVHVD